MDTPLWFDDLPVLGRMPPEQAAAKLREMGEGEVADLLEAPPTRDTGGPAFYGVFSSLFRQKLYAPTGHVFGYLAPARPGNKPLPIRDAGNVAADATLKGARVKVTLDRFRVAEYPGRGTHHILFDFYAQNQVRDNTEHLHFNALYRVREGDQAPIRGYPVFVGLNVGAEGLAFRCCTVNVKNEQDEAFLGFLESDVFKDGLKLLSGLQPALGPLSSMACALTRSIGGRNRNVRVQDFDLGLDFSTIRTRAQLAEGSYIAIQVPELAQAGWDWDKWVFNPANGQVASTSDPGQPLPYNYLVLSVSRYEEAGGPS